MGEVAKSVDESALESIALGRQPELATRELLEFYADELLYRGLKQIGEILDSPRLVKEVVAGEDRYLETTPDVKVRAVGTLVTTRKLLMKMKEEEEAKKAMEIPEEYIIADD